MLKAPFKNDGEMVTLDAFILENQLDCVVLHGRLEISADQAGLQKLLALQAQLSALSHVLNTLKNKGRLPPLIAVAQPLPPA